MAWRPEIGQRHDAAGQRRLRRQLFLPVALRERTGHQSGGADRGGTCRLLLHGAVAGLAQAGHTPTRVHTTAKVHLEKAGAGFAISRIELECEAEIPGIDDAAFQEQAAGAKANCPVSKALAGTQISLTAKLV